MCVWSLAAHQSKRESSLPLVFANVTGGGRVSKVAAGTCHGVALSGQSLSFVYLLDRLVWELFYAKYLSESEFNSIQRTTRGIGSSWFWRRKNNDVSQVPRFWLGPGDSSPDVCLLSVKPASSCSITPGPIKIAPCVPLEGKGGEAKSATRGDAWREPAFGAGGS